jgi:hypothetical protein
VKLAAAGGIAGRMMYDDGCPPLRRVAGRGDMDHAPRRKVHEKERVNLAE